MKKNKQITVQRIGLKLTTGLQAGAPGSPNGCGCRMGSAAQVLDCYDKNNKLIDQIKYDNKDAIDQFKSTYCR